MERKLIDWKTIKFIVRPDTWYDAGTEVFLDQEDITEHDYASAYFVGIHEGFNDGEYCSIFEFDWINENGDCINSNIPYLEHSIHHKDYIIENAKTGEKYNWLENKKMTTYKIK